MTASSPGSRILRVSLLILATGLACTGADKEGAAPDQARLDAGLAGTVTAQPGSPPAPPVLAASDADKTDAGKTDPGPASAPDAQDGDTGASRDGAPGVIADPGKPAQIFGPKCWGFFEFEVMGLLSQDFRIEDCTAYTHSTAAGSQLYLHFGALPGGLTSAYASILLPITPWQTGLFSNALAGGIDVVLKDGRHYQTQITALEGGTGDLPSATVQIDNVSPSGVNQPSHHVKGFFSALLRPGAGTAAASPPLHMHIQIDSPAPPGPEPRLQLDCRPQQPGAIDVRTVCNLSRSNGVMVATCAQHGGAGGFGIRVLKPELVKLGQPIALAGPDPVVQVVGNFTTHDAKLAVAGETASGSIIIHEMIPDKVLLASFVGATVGIKGTGPAPIQTCRVGNNGLQALPGQ